MSKKVLFAYNGRVEVDQQGNYYGNELNDKLVDRYLNFGDQVTFLVRLKKIQDSETKGLMPFVNGNLTIIGVPDFASPVNFIKNISEVKKIIRREVINADVLVSRLPSLIGRVAIKKALEEDKPYMVEVVGCPWDALYNHSFLGKVYAPFAYFLLKNQVKKSPYVLYVTTKFLQSRYPSDGDTTGVTDVVLNPADEKVLEKRLNKIKGLKPNQILTIGTAAGYDVKFKGQEFVIKAIAILKEKGVNFEYRPVGKGTGNKLKELAKNLGVQERVIFLGQLKHYEVFDYLDSVDIYIQPSKQEGLPRAVVEAMSRACPVIGSSTGGIPELIDDSMIFGKGNVKELVNILEKFSKDTLIDQAIVNYTSAKKFETTIMDEKRLIFYSKFKSSFSNE